MNSFNLTQNKTSDIKADNHILSIKESITSIENYSKDLNTELEKNIKDKEELFRMYNQYKFEELLIVIENMEETINNTNQKILNTKKIIWEMRGRILFNNI